MKITISKELDEKQEVLFLGMFEEDKLVDKRLAEELKEAEKRKAFAKKFGEMLPAKFLPYKKVVLLGLGKKKEFNLEKLRKILGKAVDCAKSAGYTALTTNIVDLALSCRLNAEMAGRAAAEGLMLANYNFDKYLNKEKKEKNKPVTHVVLKVKSSVSKSLTSFEKGLKTGEVIAECTNFARNLVNEPASLVNSVYLEKIATELAKNPRVKLKVLDKDEMKKLGMNALLGVNAGSRNPPKLLILEYNGGKGNGGKGNNKKGKPIAVLGKGITFDSGGYNLKPTHYIEDMKTDMAGAAAVLGLIKAACELKLNRNLIGVMPICENMVSASSQLPGDIVKAYNGKTIEIGNTDAEGRLILADALAYTEDKYKPEVMIDLATLTGACVVALGYYAAGLMGKDARLLGKLKKAGDDSGDRVWELPLYEDFDDWMDGEISDLNNIPTKGKGYEAGTITGAVFLSKFVDKVKWAHIDIAGSSCWRVDGMYQHKGATGSGVRLLSYYLLDN